MTALYDDEAALVREERDVRAPLMLADVRLKEQQFAYEPFKVFFLGMTSAAALLGGGLAIWKTTFG